MRMGNFLLAPRELLQALSSKAACRNSANDMGMSQRDALQYVSSASGGSLTSEERRSPLHLGGTGMIRPRLNSLARQDNGPGFKRLARAIENTRMEIEAGDDVFLVHEVTKRKNGAKGLGEDSATAIRHHASAFLQKRLEIIAGQIGVSVSPTAMNIEALCAAPSEALTHGPSQLPLGCPK